MFMTWFNSYYRSFVKSHKNELFSPVCLLVLPCLVLTTHSYMVVDIISTDWLNEETMVYSNTYTHMAEIANLHSVLELTKLRNIEIVYQLLSLNGVYINSCVTSCSRMVKVQLIITSLWYGYWMLLHMQQTAPAELQVNIELSLVGWLVSMVMWDTSTSTSLDMHVPASILIMSISSNL